jgi:hypothetical protein
MTVLFPEKSRWAFRRPPELDPDAVTTWLRPLFPNLALPDASHPEVELIYSAERIFVQCSVYAGRHGIRAVHTEIHDADRDQPAEGYLSKLPTVIDPLRGLARATGARLLVEGEDMTDATPAQVVKRVT